MTQCTTCPQLLPVSKDGNILAWPDMFLLDIGELEMNITACMTITIMDNYHVMSRRRHTCILMHSHMYYHQHLASVAHANMG